MPTIIQSIGVSGDFGQMSFNDPLDGVAFSSSGTGAGSSFSLSDMAQSIFIKEFEPLKYKIGINKDFASTQYALDVSGDLRVDTGPAGDRQGGHIRVQTNTRNFPGPNKIVLYETPSGIGETPTTSIGFGVDTDTLKFHTTSEYRWYYTDSGTWDYIKDASGNNISVGKMPTENGNLAMQLTDNDLSLNGNLTMHGNVALKIPVGTTAQRPTAINSTHAGYIRYNTTNSSFEGFGAGNSWGTLGGTKDVDQDTYITAEDYAGADNDQLKFFTDNTLRMTVAKNGFVGVGISNPAVALDINGSIKFTGDMQVSGGIASEADFISQCNSTSHDLIFKAGTTERVRIKGNGKVGIGTDNPSRNLHIHSSTTPYIQLTSGNTMGTGANDGFQIGMFHSNNNVFLTNYEAADIFFKTDNVEKMRIKNSGRVGIGSGSPLSMLDVNGSIRGGYNSNTTSYFGRAAVGYATVSDQAAFAHIDHNTNNGFALSQNQYGETRLNSAGAQKLYLMNQNSPLMTLLSNGNIGIGTNNPSRLLHLNTGGQTTFQMTNTNTGTGNNDGFQFIVNTSKEAYISQREAADLIFNTSAVERMRLSASGNLGIGTSSPSNTLTINGDHLDTVPILGLRSGNQHNVINNGAQIAFSWSATNQYSHFIHTRHSSSDTNLNAMDFFLCDNTANNTVTSGSNHALTLTGSSRVGIGSTTPEVSLAIVSTDAIKIPVGTTAQRPTATGSSHYGYIRYNTNNSSYEGFGAGNAWGSLGGVKDVDQDTYISAETSAGADNDELKFFTAGTERVTIGNTGNVNIKNNLTVDGDFNITGVFNKTNTNVQVTDQIDISNNGTGPALIARQHGHDNIADFYDDMYLAMRIKNGGNVGIGTSNPAVKLQIGGNANGQSVGETNVVQAATFQVFDANYRMETQQSQLAFRSQGGNGIGFYTTAETTNNIDNSKMIIKGSNVGIGTTGPTEKLHVEGNIKATGWVRGGANTNTLSQFGYMEIGSVSNYNGSALIGHASVVNNTAAGYALMQNSFGDTYLNASTTARIISFNIANNEKMRVHTNGKIGIGTNNPAMKLHLHETNANTNTTLQISHNTTGSGGSDGFHLVVERTSNIAYLIQRENANMQFYTNNTPRMAISGVGKVGIGTTNPSRELHIHNPSAGATLQLTGGTSMGTSAYDGFQFAINGTDSTAYIHQQENADMVFSTNATERMRIKNNGHIGIGTNNPSKNLDIYGSANTSLKISNANTFNIVKFHRTTSTAYSYLAELQIWINGTNVATSGTATSDDYGWGGTANKAIDNNHGTGYNAGSTTSTGWQVELAQSYAMSSIQAIEVWARNDYNTYSRLNNHEIIICNNDTILYRQEITGNSNGNSWTNGGAVVKFTGPDHSNYSGSFSSGFSTSQIVSDSWSAVGSTYTISSGSGPSFIIDQSGNDTTFNSSGKYIFNNNPILTKTVGYLGNVDEPYLIAGSTSYTGANTNWGTYGFQHRIKSLANGVARVTIDYSGNNSNVEAFCVNTMGKVGIHTNDPTHAFHVNSHMKLTGNLFLGTGSVSQSELGYLSGVTSSIQSQINTISSGGISLSLDGISDVKYGGTNFSSSLLIGNTNTGTLNNATNNVGIGKNVFYQLTSGVSNTAVGYNAMHQTTTGSYNTATGSSALYSNTTGQYNTATGCEALKSNTTANESTAIGYQSLMSNTTGDENTAIGYQSLENNTTGEYNVAVGRNALRANTTGQKNTALGRNAGDSNTTGSHNTYVGCQADANANNYDYSTTIGYDSRITASNQIVLGRSSENVNIPGKLGIGTDNPSRNLHIHATSGTPYIQLTAGTMGTGTSDGFQIGMWPSSSNAFLTNYEAGDIIFKTNNDEKMRIKNSGNFGIGTNAPTSALHIFGDRANNTQDEGIHLGRTGSSGNYNQGMEFATSGTFSYIDFKKIGTGSSDYHGRLLYNALDHNMEFYTNTARKLTIDICGNLIYGTSGNNRLDVLTDELRHFASEKHSFYYQPLNCVKYIKIDANGQSYPIHEVSLYQGTTDIAIGATTHVATSAGPVTQINASTTNITDNNTTTSYRPDESSNTNIWITLDNNIEFANLSALVIRALDRSYSDVFTKRLSQNSGTNGQMSFYDANSNLLWTAPAYQGNGSTVFHTVHVFALAQYNSSNFTTYSKNNTASLTASYSYTAPSLSTPAKVEQINFDKDTVNIPGNLVVSGTTTTLNTTNTTISDSLIELSSGLTSAANNDAGIIIERGSTGNNAFMGWDESADKFVLGTTTATGSSSGNLSITKGDLDISNVSAASITLGGSDLQAQLTNLSSGGGSQWNTVNTNEIHYSSGNVGIGTNNPDSALHINADRNNNTQSEGIHFGRNANGSDYDHAMEIVSSATNSYIDFKKTTGHSDYDGRVLYNHTDNKLRFYTNNTLGMTLNTSGYLGLSTDNPANRLDVNGTGLIYHSSATHKTAAIHAPLSLRNDGVTSTYNHGRPCLSMDWDTGSSAQWVFGQGGVTGVDGATSTMGIGWGASGTYGWTPRFFLTTDGKFGINKKIPSYKLDVDGDINFTGTLRQNGTAFSGGASTLDGLTDVKYGGSNFSNSLFIGNTTTGTLNNASNNIAIGKDAFKSVTTCPQSVAIGVSAMQSQTGGSANVAIGYEAIKSGNNNQQCVAVGWKALHSGSSFDSTAVGAYSAPWVSSGRDLVAVGRASLYGVSSGSHNTGCGVTSLLNVSTGSFNTGMGKETALTLTTGSKNSFLGYKADVNSASSSYRTVIGSEAEGTVDNSVTLGRSADIVTIPGKLGIKDTTPSYELDVTGDINFTGTLRQNGSAYSPAVTNIDISTEATPTASKATFGATILGMSVTKIRIETINGNSGHWSLGHVDVFDFDGNNLVQTSNSGFTAKMFNLSDNVEITTSNYSNYGVGNGWGRVTNIIASSLSNQLRWDNGGSSGSSYWWVGLKESHYVEVYFPSGVTDINEITVGPWNQYAFADRFGSQTKITTFNGTTQLSTYTLPSASSYSYNFYVLSPTSSYSTYVTSLISNYPNSSYLTNIITDHEPSMVTNNKMLQLSDTSTSAGTINLIPSASGARVGIGSTDPENNLHVVAKADEWAILQLEGMRSSGNRTDRPGWIGVGADGGNWGTNMLFKLRSSADETVTWDTNSKSVLYMNGQTTHMYTDDTERLTIISGGNVGINDTSPSYKLDVNGDINFTGTLYQNGSAFSGGGGGSGATALDGLTDVKRGGTNFTYSLIIGNNYPGQSVLTGTLNNAGGNTGVGWQVMKAITSGQGNTGIGADSLKNLTTGGSNVACGHRSLEALTTGGHNTSIGFLAGGNNSTASDNTALGSYTMSKSTTASNLTAVGKMALHNVTTGIRNTAVGTGALYYVTTGQYNTALGQGSGTTVTNGSYNTLIGYDAEVSSAGSQYRTVIGAGASGAVNNSVTLGRSTDIVTIPGKLGIQKTNPNYALDVTGDINFSGTLRQNGSAYSGGGGSSQWTTVNTNEIHYSSGNVGIGTNNPTEKLHVVGDILCAGTGHFTGENNTTDPNTNVTPGVHIGNYSADSGSKKYANIQLVSNSSAEYGWIDFTNSGSSYDTDREGRILYDFSNGMVFETDRNERLRIDLTGNVGIGTNNPTKNLHIHNSSGTSNLQLTNNSTGTGTIDGLQIYMNTSKNAVITNRESGYLMFATSNAERMRILADGSVKMSNNLGIGTEPDKPLHIYKVTPSASSLVEILKLEAYANTGDIASTTNGDGGYIGLYANDDNAHADGEVARISWRADNANNYEGDGKIAFWTSKSTAHPNNGGTYTMSERMTITRDGYVGIGTVTPGRQVHIHEPANDTNCHIQLTAGTSMGTAANNGFELIMSPVTNDAYLIQRENGHLRLYTNSTERMRIQNDGNVGIGNLSPQSLLDVNGSVRGAYNADTCSYFGRAAVGNCGHSDWASFSHIDSNTQTGYSLLQNTQGVTLLNSASGQKLHIRINNVDAMVVSSNKNVGIGTDNPSQKLDVRGNIYCTGHGQFTGGTVALNTTSSPPGVYLGTYSSTYGHLQIVSNNNDGGWIDWTDNQGSNTDFGARIRYGRTGTYGGMGFYTNTSERMRIATSGYVGIGTTSPNVKLHVYDGGPVMFTSTNTNHSSLTSYVGAKIIINNRASNTNSPSGEEGESHGKIIWAGHNRPKPAAFIEALSAGWDDDGELRFATSQGSQGALERMRIDNTGNVGIATDNPYCRLQLGTPNRSDGSTQSLGSLVVATTIGQATHDFSNSNSGKVGVRVVGNNATNNLQIGIGDSGYNYEPWIQGSFDNSNTSNNSYGNKKIRLNPLGGNIVRHGEDNYSDDRVKINETHITNATETLKKLKPQTYTRYAQMDSSGNIDYNSWNKFEAGLIAQEVYYDAPELRHIVTVPHDADLSGNDINTSDNPQVDPDYSNWGTDIATLSYEQLVPYLIKCVQELSNRIDELENK
jgi:hypothetical protein